MEVSYSNQNPILHVEVSAFCNMLGVSFLVVSFNDIVDLDMHGSHSIKLFFYSGRREFIVIVEVFVMWIKAIETSI